MHEPNRDGSLPEARADREESNLTPTDTPQRRQPYRAQERLVAALLVVVITTALVVMALTVRQHASELLPRSLHPLARRVGLMAKLPEMKLADPIGSPEARVKAVVIMENCLDPVQDLMLQIGTAYPDQVRAEFLSMNGPAGQAFLQEHNEGCAGVFINGKDRFQVQEGDVQKDVYLHGMPGGSYRLEHLAAVVKQEMIVAYGVVPTDFDERIQFSDAPPPGETSNRGAAAGVTFPAASPP